MSSNNYGAAGIGAEGIPTEATSLLDSGAGTRDDSSFQDRSGSAAIGDGADWLGDEEFSQVPRWRRASVYWLIGPYLLFTLAFGGSIVPKLNLILDLVCNRYLSERAQSDPGFVFIPVVPGLDDSQCTSGSTQARVQREAATFMMTMNLITGLLSAFTVPKIGSLSDRYGRKRLLVVASAGGIIGELVVILAVKFPETVHLNWLLVAAALDGLGGSFTGASVVGHSYVSDCTPPRKRGVAIGYLHSALYAGLAFGPVLAGYMVEKLTHELVSVFYVTLGCHLCFVVLILSIVPESVSQKRQLIAREKHTEDGDRRAKRVVTWTGNFAPWYRRVAASIRGAPNPLRPLKVLYPRGATNASVRRNLLLLATIDTMFLGATMGSGQVTILYSELMFGWRNLETSNFVSLVSLVRVCALLGILPALNYVFRIRPAARKRGLSHGAAVEKNNAGSDRLDMWLLRGAILSDILGVTGYILVRTPALFLLSAVVAAMGGLVSPTTQSALTKHVPADQVGSLLGAIGLLHALARVLFPLAISGLYAATVESFPQAVYVLLVVIFVLALSLAFFVRLYVYMKEVTDEDVSPTPARAWDYEDGVSDEEVVPVRLGRG
ncbi:hypothetical protein MCOR02_002348 [Pyricularia oryzae]|nr:hypothetical protein MCOR02_002348 [Pyricularia oryzae]KAI6447010.1 hypothetical protein MCOR17_010650 [Pyricularia oryzae]